MQGKKLTHIISINDKNFKECWALENLQFLPALENMCKGNKI